MNERQKSRVCIIGGGNIGTLMAAELSKTAEFVSVITSEYLQWGESLEVYDRDDQILFTSEKINVTNSFEEVVNADVVFVTYPAECFKQLATEIKPYITKEQWIGLIPGGGDIQCFFELGCTVFGFQRTHDIARVKETGKSVYSLGRKEQVYLASIPEIAQKSVCLWVEDFLDIPVIGLKDYLVITLTPSNPILHTSRLYTLFSENRKYDKQVFFYREWDDAASEILLKCDEELQNLCHVIPKDLTEVISLKKHYEVETVKDMTIKMRSIPAFQNIVAPMKSVEGVWVPDLENRYFSTDFPFGLHVVLGIAHTYAVEMPTMEMLWKWYQILTKGTIV